MFPAQAPRVCFSRGVPNLIAGSSGAPRVKVRSEAGSELRSRVAAKSIGKVERSQTQKHVPPVQLWSVSAGRLGDPAGAGIWVQPVIPAITASTPIAPQERSRTPRSTQPAPRRPKTRRHNGGGENGLQAEEE